MLTKIQIACMAPFTAMQMFGIKKEMRDVSIHPRNRYERKDRKVRNTKAPERPRAGLKQGNKHEHNANPHGGKSLRKARHNLTARINGTQQGKNPDRIRSNGNDTPWGNYGFTKPGSMK